MKRIISAFALLLAVATINGQDLAGVWVGEVTSQIDNAWPLTLELEIKQAGDSLWGRIRTHNPGTTEYVLKYFVGEVNGEQVKIMESEGTISRIVLPDGINYRWWATKEFRGTLTIDPSKDKFVMRGSCSNAAGAMRHSTGQHNLMAFSRRPGSFTLRKLTAEEVGEVEASQGQ